MLLLAPAADARSQRGVHRVAKGSMPAVRLGSADDARVRVHPLPLAIQSIATLPVDSDGKIQAGATIMLDIRVKNPNQDDGTGLEKLSLHCKKLSGGPCPFPTQTLDLPAIPKGSSHSVILAAANGAKPGRYDVVATPKPARRGSAFTVSLHVKGKIQAAGASASSAPALKTPSALTAAARRSPAARAVAASSAFGGIAARMSDEPDWRFAECTTGGPSEFPALIFTNTDTVAFPAGSSIIWVLQGEVGEFPLGISLAPGQSITGPSFEAYSSPGTPHSCLAVGKI